jgi:hypothetical protein
MFITTKIRMFVHLTVARNVAIDGVGFVRALVGADAGDGASHEGSCHLFRRKDLRRNHVVNRSRDDVFEQKLKNVNK